MEENMEKLRRKIVRIIEDYLDELDLEDAKDYEYNETQSCYHSRPLVLAEEIAAKVVQIAIPVYTDSFELNLYAAQYLSDPENRKETMLFIGLLQNLLYPGTTIHYIPGGPIRFCRYVDCINTAGEGPSLEKIRVNMNILLAMYQKFMDWILAVDMGLVTAEDAFGELLGD